MTTRITADRRRRVAELIERLSASDEVLQALERGEIDAVVDPETSATLLLGRAQRALAESEARHRELIRRCPALVCEISAEGRTTFANDVVRTVLGYSPSELTDKRWWETLVRPEHMAIARRLSALLRRGDVTGYELPLTATSGETRWILWTTSNRYKADGSLERVVAFGIDITERKRGEETAAELNQAQVARARAEAANKAKTDFLAVMSHELRTPLNSIAGYAELLEMGLRGPLTAEQREDLGKIRRSQRHLLGLINDLMNFAKLETGHVELELSDVPVNEILAVLDALTEPLIAAKQIVYEHGRCDPGLTVWADREKTHQILLNVVSNAVKFTKTNGRVTVSCELDDASVCFSVADTGEGVPESQLASIFEPFVQVRTGLTREHDGVGLGLAISRDLARMMGGDLTAVSTLGVGSRFTLRLPRRQPAAKTESE